MRKLFLLIGLFGLNTIFGQETEVELTADNSWLKAGITTGIPVGDAGDAASFNLGVDLRGQYLINPNFGVGLATGYNHFFAKDELEDFGLIPAAVFLRYYFTPTGLFFTNWKAEKTTSTFNDEWDLKWNFNIANKLGVGWHQYELPGYPASHSCLRLQERDAKFLYDWADQWVLADEQTVKIKGTPTIVFGSYDFDGTKPWYQLVANPKALDISVADIEQEVKPLLTKIMAEQEKRQNSSE